MVGLVTACGSAQEDESAAGAVTISHKFGETTVPADPSRVVTVGWSDQDFVLPFDDRTLYTTFESHLSGALTYSGPDALLYALDVLTPQLANALNGRPVADLANA
jgi:ABC-type Fe3+-hydroxamate transport system substrate-binding protein